MIPPPLLAIGVVRHRWLAQNRTHKDMQFNFMLKECLLNQPRHLIFYRIQRRQNQMAGLKEVVG